MTPEQRAAARAERQRKAIKDATGGGEMTALECWMDYRNKIVPINAPTVQVTETKRAFYAGFAYMHGILTGLSDLPDDDGVAILESVTQELLDFAKGIAEGRE
jgi:hypothetical protein